MSTPNSNQNLSNVNLTPYARKLLTSLSEREMPMWMVEYLTPEAAEALDLLRSYHLVFVQHLDFVNQDFIHITAEGYTHIGATTATAPETIAEPPASEPTPAPTTATPKLTPTEYKVLKALSLGTYLYRFGSGCRGKGKSVYQMTVDEWNWYSKDVTKAAQHLKELGFIAGSQHTDHRLTDAGRRALAEAK